MCWITKFLSLALFLVHVRALASENQESDFEHRSEKIGNTQILSDLQDPLITRPVLEVDLTDSRKNKLELENGKTLVLPKVTDAQKLVAANEEIFVPLITLPLPKAEFADSRKNKLEVEDRKTLAHSKVTDAKKFVAINVFVPVITKPAQEADVTDLGKNKLEVMDDKTAVPSKVTDAKQFVAVDWEVYVPLITLPLPKADATDSRKKLMHDKTVVRLKDIYTKQFVAAHEESYVPLITQPVPKAELTESLEKNSEGEDNKTAVVSNDTDAKLDSCLETNLDGAETVKRPNEAGTRSFKRSGLIAVTTFNFVLSICCLILSTLMSYYRLRSRAKRSLVQILYLEIGLTDLFVGVGVLSQCLILYLIIWRGKEVCDINIPVYITYMVTAVAVKMSVFINCVLGTVRCINITQPFYQINKKALTVFTLLYLATWTTIAGLDLWQFTAKRKAAKQAFVLKTFVLKGQPGFGLVLLTMNNEQLGSSYLAYHLGNLIQFILPTALPSLLCLILMIVQVYYLLRPNAIRSQKKATMKESKAGVRSQQSEESKASMTIFLLTCIYVGTSAVSILTWLTIHGRRGYLGSKSTYDRVTEKASAAASWSDLTAIYFSLSTCPLICSTLTPLTLLLRGSGPMSKHVKRVFTTITSFSDINTSTQ